MRTVRLAQPADFGAWRVRARALAAARVRPEDILWQVGGDDGDLFGAGADDSVEADAPARTLNVPRGFIDLAAQAICHSDPERFGLLYRLLLRLQDDPHLFRVATDPDVHRAEAMARAVRRDLHKMTAFVRFREVRDETGAEAFVAWFEPEHFIVERVASFFVKRFSSMRWSILTPSRSLHWDGATLHLAAGATRADAPDGDAIEVHWRTYYTNIFNPARLKIKAMKAEMPMKYWRNLPEAGLISPLIAGAPRRAREMIMNDPTPAPERHVRQTRRHPVQEPTPLDTLPRSLVEAAAAARDCARCGLCRHATQTVFGEGPLDAPVMFVGEQPGDHEDLAGRPFVGPAGRLFDRTLADAGIDRSRAYVTNAVKHFKFSLRGKRRIHQKPDAGEVQACRFWLGLERDFVKPRLIVSLGATALHALTGHAATLSSLRGRDLVLDDGARLIATVHPSYLLRLPDEATRVRESARFLADMKRILALAPVMRRADAAA